MHNNQPSSDLRSLEKQIALLEEQKAELVARVRELSLRDREKNNLIRTLFDKLPYGVMMLDEGRNVVQINQAAADILNQEKRHLIGKNCTELLTCYKQNQGCPVLEQDQSLNQVRSSCITSDKSLLRSAVVNDGPAGRIIVESFGDISELDRATIEKTIALQTKSNFLSNISHELRTPMHGIMGFSELLNAHSTELPETTKKYLQELDNSAQRLWSLLEKLFQAASLEENTISIEKVSCDFSNFSSELEKEVRLLFSGSSNQIAFKCAPTIGYVDIDPLKLHQILIGLLENANKFTKNGSIELVAEKEISERGSFLVICVADTGVGIAKHKITEIFHLFEQEDGSTNRPYQGAGLGLAIARQLAILMGGDIALKSEQGKGSVFTLRLPV